jgi:erythromycin esterase
MDLINPDNLDPLFEQIGRDKLQFVLLGEAFHGTSEFYSWRSEITKSLIRERRFSFMAVERDWPDCFYRWPTWMCANRETVDLIEWLREYNRSLPEGGFLWIRWV